MFRKGALQRHDTLGKADSRWSFLNRKAGEKESTEDMMMIDTKPKGMPSDDDIGADPVSAQAPSKALHVNFATATDIGGMKENQDMCMVWSDDTGYNYAFCVFDGHGKEVGRLAARAAARFMSSWFEKHFDSILSNPLLALNHLFRGTHSYIKQSFIKHYREAKQMEVSEGYGSSRGRTGAKGPHAEPYLLKRSNRLRQYTCIFGGTSASVVLVFGHPDIDKVIIANVGDSSGIFSSLPYNTGSKVGTGLTSNARKAHREEAIRMAPPVFTPQTRRYVGDVALDVHDHDAMLDLSRGGGVPGAAAANGDSILAEPKSGQPDQPNGNGHQGSGGSGSGSGSGSSSSDNKAEGDAFARASEIGLARIGSWGLEVETGLVVESSNLPAPSSSTSSSSSASGSSSSGPDRSRGGRKGDVVTDAEGEYISGGDDKIDSNLLVVTADHSPESVKEYIRMCFTHPPNDGTNPSPSSPSPAASSASASDNNEGKKGVGDGSSSSSTTTTTTAALAAVAAPGSGGNTNLGHVTPGCRPMLEIIYDSPGGDKTRCNEIFARVGESLSPSKRKSKGNSSSSGASGSGSGSGSGENERRAGRVPTVVVTNDGAYWKNVRQEWASLVATPPYAKFHDALAFTRSLGDFHLQHYGVSHLPEVFVIDNFRRRYLDGEGATTPAGSAAGSAGGSKRKTLSPKGSKRQIDTAEFGACGGICLLLASDGIWDNWRFGDVAAGLTGAVLKEVERGLSSTASTQSLLDNAAGGGSSGGGGGGGGGAKRSHAAAATASTGGTAAGGAGGAGGAAMVLPGFYAVNESQCRRALEHFMAQNAARAEANFGSSADNSTAILAVFTSVAPSAGGAGAGAGGGAAARSQEKAIGAGGAK